VTKSCVENFPICWQEFSFIFKLQKNLFLLKE
jgi:hypothetical protein